MSLNSTPPQGYMIPTGPPSGRYLGACVVGIIAHLGVFIRGEWHLLAPLVALAHGVAFWSIVAAHSLAGPLSASLWEACRFSIAYLFGLYGSMTIYRLLLHRLCGFPGPRMAALTKLWHVYRCRDFRNHLELDALHKKYGSFVRTGPEELTIFHPEIFEAMDGPLNGNVRSDWYDMMNPLISPIFSRSDRDHREYRRPWDLALSAKSIKEYVPRILSQIDLLQQAIGQYKGGPVLINDVMSWFAFDSMGEFAFNQSFDMLKTRNWHPIIARQRSALVIQGLFHPAVWAMRIAFTITSMLPFWRFRDWLDVLQFSDQCMEKRMKTKPEQPDMASWFIQEFEKNEATADSTTRRNLLSGNTISVIVGGSDTVGPSLIALFYFLTLHPTHANLIRQELATVDKCDIAALAALPHLNGCMNESMCLIPAGLSMGSRKTPLEGLVIDGTYVPGGVKISASRYSIFRMDSSFEDPLSFMPERWYSRREMVKNPRAFSPFGVGRRACVGKSLAQTQIRLVIAHLLSRYRFSFAPDTNVANIEGEMRDQFSARMGPVSLLFEDI